MRHGGPKREDLQQWLDGWLTEEAGGRCDPMPRMLASIGFVRSVMEAWMADEVQNYLTSEIETLRSAVFRAGALNAKTLGPCAEAHLENVLRFVVMSDEVEEATYLAVSRVGLFARALYAQARIGEIEQARRDALIAIDALAIVAESSVPREASHLAAALEAESHRPDPVARVGG